MNPDLLHRLRRTADIPKRLHSMPVFVLLSLLWLLPTRLAAQMPPDVGQKAPDFRLKTPEGTDVSLSGLVQTGSV